MVAFWAVLMLISFVLLLVGAVGMATALGWLDVQPTVVASLVGVATALVPVLSKVLKSRGGKGGGADSAGSEEL